MDDDDPIDALLGELLDAYERQRALDTPLSRARSFAIRRRRRVALACAAALVLTASATAAVVVATRRSAPLTGALPPELLGSRYAVRVIPDLTAGHVGWCVSLLDSRTTDAVLPDPENCSSSDNGPVIFRGGIATLSPSTGAVDAWLLYAIVDERVAALRTPVGTRLRPISSRFLPIGWRAAVTVSRDPTTVRSGVVTLTPLNSRGEELRTGVGEPVVFPTRRVDHGHALGSGCMIESHGLRGVRILEARALNTAQPGRLVRTSPLSCYSMRISYRRASSVASLILTPPPRADRTATLPGFARLSGHPEIEGERAGEGDGGALSYRGNTLLARRAGAAWLVLSTSSREATAVRLLESLTAHT